MRKQIAERLDERLRDMRSADGGNYDDEELAGLVDVAQTIRRVASRATPSPERQERALTELRAVLAEDRQRGASVPSETGGAWRTITAAGQRIRGLWTFRPALPQAAVVLGAIILAGGAFIGASAAGADVSQPIRALFSSDSQVKVEGVIVEVEPGSIVVQTNDGNVALTLEDDVEIVGAANSPVSAEDLAVGQSIEVKGEQQPDGTILALRVKIE